MIVILSSAISAGRLKKHLASEGIPSELIQTPAALSKGGCSYSLKFSEMYTKNVSHGISILHITSKGIYKEQTNGKNITYIKY